MRQAFMVVSAALLLGGCAGYLADNYSSTRFDGYTQADGKPLAIALHRSKPAFVTQVDAGTAIAQAFSGSAGRDYPDAVHRKAADEMLRRLGARGCRVTATRRIDAITVEHDYSCRDGRTLTADDIASVTEQGVLKRR